MRRILFLIAGFSLLLISCSVSEQDVQENPAFFTAELEQAAPATKTYLDEYFYVVWNSGDYLDVFEKNSVPVRYRFLGTDGSTGGSLIRDPEATDGQVGDEVSSYYAVFPHESGNVGMDPQGKIIAEIHDVQTYGEYSFGPTDNIMAAVSTGTNFSFKNVGGWIVLKLYGEGSVSKITLKGNGNEVIAGKVKISFTDGLPAAEPMPRQSSSWRREITMSFPDGPVSLGPTKEEATEFWFVLRPIGLPQGVTFVVTDPFGRTFEKVVTNSYEVQRNQYLGLRTRVVFSTPVSSVSLDAAEAAMTVGETRTLVATVLPSNATDKSVTWSSSDETVATVDAEGKVTALKVGTATITAKAGEKTAECVVTVSPVSVTGVTLDKEELALKPGEISTLTATVLPENAADKSVTWSSSDTGVATVDANGKVTAKSVGTATVTVTTTDGGKKATCAITVTPILVSGITLNSTTASVNVGATTTLTATVTPSNAADKAVTWSSSNTAVATVNASGVVTGVKAGTATITATAHDGSGVKASCTVTVSNIAVTGLTLNKTTLSLVNGTSETLTATVTPENATDKTVTWASSNTSVAMVSNGTVTAKGVGTATITATAGGKSATCTVTVTPIKVSSITLNNTSVSIIVGSTTTLSPTVMPTNAADKTITWSSSNSAVATVSTSGVVTGIKAGTATITATAHDGSGVKATCNVTVSNVAVTGVTLNKSELTLPIGGTETLIPSVLPSNATNQSVTWSTSSSTIATVSNGTVTAKAKGTATITVRTNNGYTATCAVTVDASENTRNDYTYSSGGWED